MFTRSHLEEMKRRYASMYASPVEITEASGSITITVKGISDLKKADAQMLRDTDLILKRYYKMMEWRSKKEVLLTKEIPLHLKQIVQI